jgi:hypothetical protein
MALDRPTLCGLPTCSATSSGWRALRSTPSAGRRRTQLAARSGSFACCSWTRHSEISRPRSPWLWLMLGSDCTAGAVSNHPSPSAGSRHAAMSTSPATNRERHVAIGRGPSGSMACSGQRCPERAHMKAGRSFMFSSHLPAFMFKFDHYPTRGVRGRAGTPARWSVERPRGVETGARPRLRRAACALAALRGGSARPI